MITQVAESSPYRRLDGVIDEATLIAARLDAAAREARLRLAVLIDAGPGDPQPQRTIVLHCVSRIVAWLRQVRYEPDPDAYWSRPGKPVHVPRDLDPPIPLRDVAELGTWLARWHGSDIYGQPDEIFDAAAEPGWLPRASLDVSLPPAPSPVHTLDLWLDANATAGHHHLDLRIEFGSLQILGQDGHDEPISTLAAAVGHWWQQMRTGHTRGSYGIVPGGDRPPADPKR